MAKGGSVDDAMMMFYCLVNMMGEDLQSIQSCPADLILLEGKIEAVTVTLEMIRGQLKEAIAAYRDAHDPQAIRSRRLRAEAEERLRRWDASRRKPSSRPPKAEKPAAAQADAAPDAGKKAGAKGV